MSNRDKLLADWQAASTQLRALVAHERELRRQVVEAFSHDVAPGHSGTETVDVGWGYKLKIVHKIEYKLGAADKVDAVLDKIERSMEGGSIIAERLVRWKPELSVTEYKLLSPDNKKLVDDVLTITDAMPSVELVPPKGA